MAMIEKYLFRIYFWILTTILSFRFYCQPAPPIDEKYLNLIN